MEIQLYTICHSP